MLKTVFLREIAEITAGQSAPQEKDSFSTDGYPFLRAGSLETLMGGASENTLERINIKIANRNGLRLFPKGTIVFAKSGMSATKNRVYVLESPCYVVSHLAVIIPEQEEDSGFLSYWFRNYGPSQLIKDKSYPSIRLGDIENIKIPKTPKEIQRKIASILQKAESVGEKRKETIRLVDEFIKSVFLDMFGDPVRNPKKWKILHFEELGSIERGVSKNRPRNDPKLLGGPYPLIQTGDIANASTYVRIYKQTYSEIGLKQSKLWRKGTLCITIAANIAKTGILTFDACFPDSVVGFTPNTLTCTEYIQYWMSFIQKRLEDMAPESAQKNINLGILRNLTLPVPPIELQNKFADIVQKVEKLKEKQRESEKELDNLFNSLMQRAFRGDLF